MRSPSTFTLKVLFSLLFGALAYAQKGDPASSSPKNILSNGDFSKGLACYGDYGWTNGYRFGLSTDAHSPPYAAEIKCEGAC